jgi:Sensors of blue-light using FAD
MDMFSLVYVSSVVKPFSPTELAELLAVCHRNNAALGVTGLLLYKDGNVMQALEGDEADVLELHARIGRDPRHHHLLTLLQGPVNERQFPDWSMGFRDLRARDAADAVGYSEFLNTPLTGQEFSSDPTRCQRLLMTFKQSM